jgi:hypothetical protein
MNGWAIFAKGDVVSHEWLGYFRQGSISPIITDMFEDLPNG